MKLNSTFTTRKTIAMLFVLVGLFSSKNITAQISTVCTDPTNIIYGLTGNGEIREVNVNTAATGAVVKNTTYTGNSASSANGLAYNYVNGKFYYFKRNVSKSSQEFVSFKPATGVVTILATSTCTDDVHTGCVTASGTGYYTVDTDGNLSYYNITTNTWTFITSSIIDQDGNDVDAIIRSQSAGDMAIDGWNNIWLVTSSNSNYGVYKFPASLPTTPVATFVVTRVIAPTASTPTGNSFAGIAFNPTGQIYMSTKSDNKLYRLNDNQTLTFIGNLGTSDIGNDLTSCNFPFLVLPINWNKFEATVSNNNIIKLEWQVTEENGNGFYIEHSLDGSKWEDIAFIPSKHEELNPVYSYFHNNNLNGKQYYRIRQVDADGKKNYSEIRIVTLQNSNKNISVWPNPATDQIRIAKDADDKNSFSKAQVFDLSGRMLLENKLQSDMSTINVSMLPKGTYIVRVQTNNGIVYNQKISKQ